LDIHSRIVSWASASAKSSSGVSPDSPVASARPSSRYTKDIVLGVPGATPSGVETRDTSWKVA
jgi:hypothetical protein